MGLDRRRVRVPVEYNQYKVVKMNDVRPADAGAIRRYFVEGPQEVLTDERGLLTIDTIEDNSVNESGIAGERLPDKALVYLAADGRWYLQDTDSALLRLSSYRGIVNNRQAIEPNGTGLICTSGYVYGYNGLKPGAIIYASSTPGDYSDTKPVLMLGGPQQAIAPIGTASVDGTKIKVAPTPIVYQKRVSLAQDGTTTIQHHQDTYAPTRQIDAYMAVDTIALSATYAFSNRDIGIPLRGPTYAGGVTTVATSGTGSATVGNLTVVAVLTTQRVAQSFQSPGGKLSQITVQHGPHVGTPSGNVIWEIRANTSNNPGSTVLQSGSYTPQASTNNVIPIPNGIVLEPNTTYWLVLSPSQPMISLAGWTVLYATNNPYNTGLLKSDTALVGGLLFGNNWQNVGGNTQSDLRCTITVDAIPVNDMTAQPFYVDTNSLVTSVRLQLWKVGNPNGTLSLVIRASTGGIPGAILGTANTMSASSLSTTPQTVEFTFASPLALTANVPYFIDMTTTDMQSAVNYVMVGSDQSTPDTTYGYAQRQTGGNWVTITPASELVFELYSRSTAISRGVAIGYPLAGIWWDAGDGTGASADTMTAFTNKTGAPLPDVVLSVRFDE